MWAEVHKGEQRSPEVNRSEEQEWTQGNRSQQKYETAEIQNQRRAPRRVGRRATFEVVEVNSRSTGGQQEVNRRHKTRVSKPPRDEQRSTRGQQEVDSVLKMRVANLDEVKVKGGQQSSINMR